jgi:drug/metabolite transporter (DMT)-like permease
MKYFYAFTVLFLGMAIFGSGTPVSKLVVQEFPPLVGSFLRMLIAALVLSPFVIKDWNTFKNVSKRNWIIISAIALIGMVSFSVFMLYGMRLVSGVVGSIVMSTTPAVTTFGAALFLKEHLGWRKILAIAFAVAGVVVINISGAGGAQTQITSLMLGSILVFGAVVSEATYTLLGRIATQDINPLALAGLAAWIASILFLPLALWQSGDVQWSNISLSDWASVAWWGVGTMALGSSLWYSGVQKVPGSIAAGFMSVMPVSALVLSYLLLGEEFQWIHMIGFGLVFIGVLLICWSHARMMKKPS